MTKKTYERKGFRHSYKTEDGRGYTHFGVLGDPEDGRGNVSQNEDIHSRHCPCGWAKGARRESIRKSLNNHWSRRQKRVAANGGV